MIVVGLTKWPTVINPIHSRSNDNISVSFCGHHSNQIAMVLQRKERCILYNRICFVNPFKSKFWIKFIIIDVDCPFVPHTVSVLVTFRNTTYLWFCVWKWNVFCYIYWHHLYDNRVLLLYALLFSDDICLREVLCDLIILSAI